MHAKHADDSALFIGYGLPGLFNALFFDGNEPGESEMPHTNANRPVIANWWFPRRGAI
jgi:hypothetical protein